MYEYIPKPDRRPALFLTLLLSVASVCCMLPTSPALTAPLRALGVLCALAAIMLAALSFFTTVLCMRDVLAARDELQNKEN